MDGWEAKGGLFLFCWILFSAVLSFWERGAQQEQQQQENPFVAFSSRPKGRGQIGNCWRRWQGTSGGVRARNIDCSRWMMEMGGSRRARLFSLFNCSSCLYFQIPRNVTVWFFGDSGLLLNEMDGLFWLLRLVPR